MFYYMFMPLNCHIDGGFGATGDAFYEAAQKLFADNEKTNFLNANLPINFLLRHTIELYLKSLVIVIHRVLQISFGDSPDETPSIQIGEKWKPVYQVHSVNELYTYLKKIVCDNKSQIQSMAKTDWSAIFHPKLDGWIELIEKYDGRSTFFRYPVTGNQENDYKKSAWQEVPADELAKSLHNNEEKTRSFVFVDDNYNVVTAYQYDDEIMKQVHEALKEASDLLSNAHCGMRVELAGGK